MNHSKQDAQQENSANKHPDYKERQIVEFYVHASSLDKKRLEHQLEALRD